MKNKFKVNKLFLYNHFTYFFYLSKKSFHLFFLSGRLNNFKIHKILINLIFFCIFHGKSNMRK